MRESHQPPIRCRGSYRSVPLHSARRSHLQSHRVRRRKYAGVLAAASLGRSRIAPPCRDAAGTADDEPPQETKRRGGHRPWAELLKRTFDIEVLSRPSCRGRMRLLAMVTESKSIHRYLAKIGEPTSTHRLSRAECGRSSRPWHRSARVTSALRARSEFPTWSTWPSMERSDARPNADCLADSPNPRLARCAQ